MSILSHGLTADSSDAGRHPACVAFEQVLDMIIADQDTGNSYVMRRFTEEYGESCAASVMQAAGIRRLRCKHLARRDAKNWCGPENPETWAGDPERRKTPETGDAP